MFIVEQGWISSSKVSKISKPKSWIIFFLTGFLLFSFFCSPSCEGVFKSITSNLFSFGFFTSFAVLSFIWLGIGDLSSCSGVFMSFVLLLSGFTSSEFLSLVSFSLDWFSFNSDWLLSDICFSGFFSGF